MVDDHSESAQDAWAQVPMASLVEPRNNAEMSDPLPDQVLPPDDTPEWRFEGQIRFMGEDGVDVPLWGDGGHIFGDGDELIREWGVTEALARDIVAWGRAWQDADDGEIDDEAVRLIRRLGAELDGRFVIVYQP